MADEFVQAGEQQVRFVAHVAFQGTAGAGFMRFKQRAIAVGLTGGEDVEREVVAVAFVLGACVGGEHDGLLSRVAA